MKCPAWNDKCDYCQYTGHWSTVCRKKETEGVNALQLAHIIYDSSTDTFTSPTKEVQEIPALLTPFNRDTQYNNTASQLKIFPDSGATVCIAGTNHLKILGTRMDFLIPTNKSVTAVGGTKLTCHGWIPVKFNIGKHVTKQPLYICDKVDRIYFSRKGCTETKILPKTFPFPMDSNPGEVCAINSATESNSGTNLQTIPPRPEKIPFPPTEEHIPHLEKYLLEKFEATAFNRSATPFPTMSGRQPPAHIHVLDNAKPRAYHTPIPVPLHLRDGVKKQLDEDVLRGIIAPVPANEPTVWCSHMIILQKKDGSIRRTIDLQHLNAQCLRETHHTPSPFQLACQIPPHMKKTTFDAVDGYHSVELDEESQKLTTFITEWGRYRYKRLTQGHISAGDSYTFRYDDIIRDVEDKVKCVDDTCLFKPTIKEAFFHAWDYLNLCAENGIVINKEKFKFCRDNVLFAGLHITSTGIEPSESLLNAIKNFPAPKDITGARSWFGLVNQTSWAYSISKIMLPFRELVRPNSTFKWDATLQKLFEESKVTLLNAISEGIRTYDTSRPTIIQCDWSKDGIGYLLLQKHCSCSMDNIPNCCNEGWKLVYAGSRFTKQTERGYCPLEGEALAVSWSLEHARMFILGCPNLTVVTDHKPLLGLFNDRELGSIENLRVQRFKSRTLHYRFNIKHCPGKWHRGADAVSRYPVEETPNFPVAALCTEVPDQHEDEHNDNWDIESCEETLNLCTISAIHDINNSNTDAAITMDILSDTAKDDEPYQLLIKTILNGFPRSRNETPASIRNFWEMRQRLSIFKNIVLLDKRLVIPTKLRSKVLQLLHSAHQGCTGMKSRANISVYWPGINSSVLNLRAECRSCTSHSPSQSREPIIVTPPTEWPFQKVCGDYFDINGRGYLTIVDRFSGWISLYHFPLSATAAQLISCCRSLFITFGTPEELGSDGGPQLTAVAFQNFLTTWGIHHRKSSVEYPQSNGRAELGVKTAKRILRENVSSNGSLDNDKTARAILQYHNTPLPGIHLSPSQILFHRQLRDQIPTLPSQYQLHEEWLKLAKTREVLLHQRNTHLLEKYNSATHPLKPLTVGTHVVIQDNTRKHKLWDRTGIVVECLPYRQYNIRMDGSGRITLRNRRFLRPDYVSRTTAIMPSAIVPKTNNGLTHTPVVENHVAAPSTTMAIPTAAPAAPATPHTITTAPRPPSKIPRMLRNLQTYNKPGRLEQ